MRSEAKWALRLGGLLALAIAGCNTLLGIDPAQDGVWDGSTAAGDDDDSDDGGSTSVPPNSSSGGSSGGSSSGGGGVDADSFQSDATAVWADWPMPNVPDSGLPNPQSYDASSPDYVYDSVTGLTWERVVDTTNYVNGTDGGVSWSAAIAYCSDLPLDDGGWRLPARIELVSLLNLNIDPAIDPVAFVNPPAKVFWTSSSLASDPSSAWNVNFGFSQLLISTDVKSALHFVRCVR